MFLLAESSFTPPVQFAAWLACAFFASALFNQLHKSYRNLKGPDAHPPSGELDLRVKLVEGDLTSVKSDVRSVSGKVDKLREDIVTNGDVRKKDIEGKVESTRLELTEQTESVRKELSEQIDKMSDQIMETPARVMALLRNAGRIK